MIGLEPTAAQGLRLTREQLTLCAGMLGARDLIGVGPLAPLDELEGTVAARSLAARGVLVPGLDGEPALADVVADALAPLVPGQPSVAAWVRHPTAGCWSCVRTAGAAGRATVITEHRAEASYRVGSVPVGEALAGTLGALERGLANPGDPGALWEVGIVRTAASGSQRGRTFHWGPDADGLRLVTSSKLRRSRSVEAAELVADIEAELHGLDLERPADAH